MSFFGNAKSQTLTCAIAFAFIGGMLWLVITANRATMSEFDKSMTAEQHLMMEEIKKQPKYKYEYPKGSYKQSAKLSDPEYRREVNKTYYQKNRIKIIEGQKKRYREKHPEDEKKKKKYINKELIEFVKKKGDVENEV